MNTTAPTFRVLGTAESQVTLAIDAVRGEPWAFNGRPSLRAALHDRRKDIARAEHLDDAARELAYRCLLEAAGLLAEADAIVDAEPKLPTGWWFAQHHRGAAHYVGPGATVMVHTGGSRVTIGAGTAIDSATIVAIVADARRRVGGGL